MIEEVSNYLNEMRHDFTKAKLDEENTTSNPMEQYAKWFEDAVGAQVPDPKAMTVCTVDAHGVPSSRVVYSRGLTEEGIIFYTNYDSKKGADLKQNNNVSVTIYWTELERQMRFTGVAEKLPGAESDAYFASRPRESQIGAWASDQSSELKSRTELEEKVAHFTKKFEGKDVPRPPFWGGYIIKISVFEFWQGRASRLHDRIEYSKDKKGNWRKRRLSP